MDVGKLIQVAEDNLRYTAGSGSFEMPGEMKSISFQEAQAYALVAIAKSLQMQEAGPCGAQTPVIRGGSQIFCPLKAGHAGLHTDGVTTWDNGAPVPDRTTPKNCGALPPDSTGRPGRCIMPAGHISPHSDGGNRWAHAVAEPTKPAVDRLHELQSYLVSESEKALGRARETLAAAPYPGQHVEVSKAYDDAATKLQEILQEGGL